MKNVNIEFAPAPISSTTLSSPVFMFVYIAGDLRHFEMLCSSICLCFIARSIKESSKNLKGKCATSWHDFQYQVTGHYLRDGGGGGKGGAGGGGYKMGKSRVRTFLGPLSR